MPLETEYALRLKYVLQELANNVETHLMDILKDEPRIDRVSARAKSVERFMGKAAKKEENGAVKYSDPLSQIQDQVGARIVTFYTSDVERISSVVERYFRPVESRRLVPDSEWSFGYEGKHYVLLMPRDVVDQKWDKQQVPDFFELQIKTLFQHAWAEANHDLGYKPGLRELTSDELRSLAFTAAQSWGADRIFNELFEAR